MRLVVLASPLSLQILYAIDSFPPVSVHLEPLQGRFEPSCWRAALIVAVESGLTTDNRSPRLTPSGTIHGMHESFLFIVHSSDDYSIK